MIIPASLINAANAEAPRWELGQSRARSGTPGTPGIPGKSHNTRPPQQEPYGGWGGGQECKGTRAQSVPPRAAGSPHPPAATAVLRVRYDDHRGQRTQRRLIPGCVLPEILQNSVFYPSTIKHYFSTNAQAALE